MNAIRNRTPQPAFRLAAFVLVSALLAPASAPAGLGDCSQPISTGNQPATSDCLRILKVAVGSATCTPACICAPKGTLPTTAADALRCLRKAVGQPVTLNCPCSSLPTGDNFNDNSKDPALWSDDSIDGNGVLTEINQTLRYTANSGTEFDYVTRDWIGSLMPYASDWEVQMDIANFTILDNNDEYNSFGILISDASDFANYAYAELLNFGGPPIEKGFYAELYDNDVFIQDADTHDIPNLTTGAVRLSFDAGTKVIELFYDINPSNGYQWVSFGSFGVDGSGGQSGNADWSFTDADRFLVSVYGYSEFMSIAAGEVYGDNFQTTGGVEP